MSDEQGTLGTAMAGFKAIDGQRNIKKKQGLRTLVELNAEHTGAVLPSS